MFQSFSQEVQEEEMEVVHQSSPPCLRPSNHLLWWAFTNLMIHKGGTLFTSICLPISPVMVLFYVKSPHFKGPNGILDGDNCLDKLLLYSFSVGVMLCPHFFLCGVTLIIFTESLPIKRKRHQPKHINDSSILLLKQSGLGTKFIPVGLVVNAYVQKGVKYMISHIEFCGNHHI
jgi:hypothetical protein